MFDANMIYRYIAQDHLAEIEGAEAIGVDLLRDVFAVSPHMGGHVIACVQYTVIVVILRILILPAAIALLVRLVLSTKLVRLNVVLQEAKYWEKRCKKWN